MNQHGAVLAARFMAVSCLPCWSTANMEAVCSSWQVDWLSLAYTALCPGRSIELFIIIAVKTTHPTKLVFEWKCKRSLLLLRSVALAAGPALKFDVFIWASWLKKMRWARFLRACWCVFFCWYHSAIAPWSLSPSPEACCSSEQAAQYHILGL